MSDIRGAALAPTDERPYVSMVASVPHATGDSLVGSFEKGVSSVKRIRIGASDHLAARPLLFGLLEDRPAGVELVYGEPGMLALWLERGDVDAALIPSIEFLRGVGECAVHGPALVARGRTMGLLLVAQQPLTLVRRIAVEEFCRTPLVALRAVLDRLFGVLPDLCVVKQRPLDTANWREDFDAVLLTDDEGLRYGCQGSRPGETSYDVGAMWQSLYTCPLVMSLWAHNGGAVGREVESMIVSSRDRGVGNLKALSEKVARTTSHDAEFLHQYYAAAWSYDLGIAEEEGLRVLQDVACGYQLLQGRRAEKVVTT